MEAIQKKSKNSLFKKLGFSGIGLCALLCALPIIGTVLGIGALTAAAAYFEKIGLAVLVLSGGLLGYWFIKKKRSAEAVVPSCDIHCGCKTEASAVSES
jgi:hypothetical protein